MFGTLEPDVYFYGETIEKIGADKYRITKGGFTTCVQPTPRWDIVSGSATINLDDYVILRNAVDPGEGRAGVLPAGAVLPDSGVTIAPPGFLMPMYGRSLTAGQSLSNAFFWAINRSQDLTLFHDWCSRAATGVGSEYRYMASARRRRATSRATGSTRRRRSINGAAAARRGRSKTI